MALEVKGFFGPDSKIWLILYVFAIILFPLIGLNIPEIFLRSEFSITLAKLFFIVALFTLVMLLVKTITLLGRDKNTFRVYLMVTSICLLIFLINLDLFLTL